MSAIADVIAPGCLLLCNESFAATNPREGCEIARQVVRALVMSCILVFRHAPAHHRRTGFRFIRRPLRSSCGRSERSSGSAYSEWLSGIRCP